LTQPWYRWDTTVDKQIATAEGANSRGCQISSSNNKLILLPPRP
jgi:hypothetical protein